MPRILLVDDDPEIAALVARRLSAAGYAVETAASGRAALAAAVSARLDAIVLDRMLPDIDGMAVLSALRTARVESPVLVLSALGATGERIAGLRAGADDYLAKPFDPEELLARLEVLLRRPTPARPGGRLVVADLVLDPVAMGARRGARALDLSPREFQMLRYLMEREGRVVTRAMLLEGVWSYRTDHESNIIDVHISRLRRKVDGEGEPQLIHTVRGLGYLIGTRTDL